MKKLTREEIIKMLEKGNKDFSNLDLRDVDFYKLDLSYADLSYSDLSYVDLSDVNLSGAALCETDLSCANLCGANLHCADLSNANLSCADLTRADLSYATFENTELECANLFETKLDTCEQIRKGIIVDQPMIGWKRCRENLDVTLEIPKGAIVFSINNDGCRTNKAKVIGITDGKKIAYSLHDESFVYELGKEIEIKDFNLMYNIECTTGIHFYRR